MFEKEAEKYADWFWGASPSAQRAIKLAYQQGAEFGYKKAIIEANEIIKEMLSILPKENIEGIYEITEEAEQFLKESE